jgi:hypothetical protein
MALQAIGSFSTQNQPADILTGVDYLLEEANVIFKDDNSLKVTEKSGTPNLSVDVAAGECLILYDSYALGGGNQRYFPFRNSASANVTISSNASGNPRITSIFAKVDSAAVTSTRGVNAASLVALDGTPAASPTATATPANHYKLADVTVASGASSILNANITDSRSEAKLRNEIFDQPYTANNKGYQVKKTDGTVTNVGNINASNVLVLGASTLSGVNLNGNSLDWGNWGVTITAGGSMQIKNPTIVEAKYVRIEDIVLLNLRASFETTVSANNSIVFNAPIVPANDVAFGAWGNCWVRDNSSDISGIVFWDTSSQAFFCRKTGAASFALTTGQTLNVNMFYRVA